jgi:GTP-binding protein
MARARAGLPVTAVAAATGEGLAPLRHLLAQILPGQDDLSRPPEPAGVVIHRLATMPGGFAVELEDDGTYRVRGDRIERAAAQTNFEIEESADRFQRTLARQGIDAELRRQGVRPGDLVRIGALELEWEPAAWEDE